MLPKLLTALVAALVLAPAAAARPRAGLVVVAIDGDGKLVAAGLTVNGLTTEFALLRALP